MATWLAALIAIAALTLTYFTCIRPMRRGQQGCCSEASTSSAKVAELREELRALREQKDLRA